MNKVELIFEEMIDVLKSPKSAVKKFKELTGKKAIGCFPVYCPEEIIHAAGMLPVGIWGGQTNIELAKQYFPAFACSIMQSCLEYGLKGTYNDLSAVIIPGMCDTLICMGQNWKVGVPNVQYISLVHPQNRKLEAGITYLKSEYANIKNKLEEIGGYSISNDSINSSIEIYNEHRKTMRSFNELVADYPDLITPLKRNIVIRSGYFIEKGRHTDLVKELINQIKKVPLKESKKKRVMLSGILADSKDLLNIFEENNLAVVADDLAQETRQFRYDVPRGEDALDRLARYWSIFEGCSLAYDPEKMRAKIIIDEIKKNGIDGVIFCMMKFCDPEEYDYPIIKSAIDNEGIPTLFLEIDQQMENNEQVRTRVQAFAEILSF